MIDFSKMSVGEAITTAKDAGFLIGMVLSAVLFGWKGRNLVQPIYDFFENASTFMKESKLHQQTMEHQMNLLLTNHLQHIEADLKSLSGRDREI